MFRNLHVAAAIAMLATLPLSANALPFSGSFTVLASSTNGSGNTADVFGLAYGTALPSGASWTVAPDTITPPPASTTNVFMSPWANTGFADDTTSVEGAQDKQYYSVQPLAVGADPASANPAKLGFLAPVSLFKMLWGSIDSYNEVTFFNGVTDLGTVTGTDVATLIGIGGPKCGSSPSFNCVAEVQFSGVSFNRIEFRSIGSNSLEFATAIPLPAAAWLLLGVSGALVAAKRRSSRRNAA